MDYREIRSLLEKYWDCECTQEEEVAIRSFFERVETGTLPDDLKGVAPLFGLWAEEANVTMPEDAEWNAMLHKIQAEETQPAGPSGIQIPRWWRYAAAVILLLGATWGILQMKQPKPPVIAVNQTKADTYKDPEKAFEATRKALMIVAANLNKGKQGIQKISEFNEAEEKIRASEPDKKSD